MKRKVLVIGDSYMNLQMSVPAAVKSSETVYGDKYAFHPCGSSAVSAVTAAKSGADCAFCTRLGDDSNGEKLYNYYKSCGVDTTFVKKMPNVQTGLEFTAYDNLNSLSYITKGANVYLSKADIDDAFSCCPDVMLVSHDYIALSDANKDVPSMYSDTSAADFKPIVQPQTARPENLALYAINKALERGIEMIVEYTDTTAMLPLEKVNHIKMVVISEELLRKVTGTVTTSIEKTLSALLAFSSKIHAKYYIVQKGNDKSFIYDGIHFEITQAPSVISALSHQENQTMNQTYMGAMIAEYLSTKDILRACKYAQIVSLMTRAPYGIFQHVPNRAQVYKFLEEHDLSLDTI